MVAHLLFAAVIVLGTFVYVRSRENSVAGERLAQLSARWNGDTGSSARKRPDGTSRLTRADFALVVQLFVVAFRQGASVSACLVHVGEAVRGSPVAGCLTAVGRSLNRGAQWNSAWNCITEAPEGQRELLIRLRDALEPSWSQGLSPVGRLASLAAALLEEEEASVEVSASKLSVRLLIPTGLCFLPAFILIGVIPCVAAFAGG